MYILIPLVTHLAHSGVKHTLTWSSGQRAAASSGEAEKGLGERVRNLQADVGIERAMESEPASLQLEVKTLTSRPQLPHIRLLISSSLPTNFP